jgi:hypothetical protein
MSQVKMLNDLLIPDITNIIVDYNMPEKPYRYYVVFFDYIKIATERNLNVDKNFYVTMEDLNLFYRIKKIKFDYYENKHYPNIY